MTIKWLEKDNRQRKSKMQERRTAKKLSGRVQAGSGMFQGAKGDVRTDIELIENKRTDKSQITIKKSWLEKIRREAIKDNRIPVLSIEIGGKNYYIIEECYYGN